MSGAFKITGSSLVSSLAILGQTFMYGTYSILVNLSISGGQVSYLSSSLVLSTEVLKLAICLGMLWPQYKRKRLPSTSCLDLLSFSIPAICYAVNNNLAFYMQSQMDPTTYMVLGNLKILTTALLYRFFMKEYINFTQGFLLGCLTINGILIRFAFIFDRCFAALDSKTTSLSETHVSLLGIVLLGCYCTISGFAGVYTEYKLKTKQELSLLHQNTFLYSFGVVFNLAAWIVQASKFQIDHPFFLFSGYSWSTWSLVITQATVGLGMGYVLKYKGSIVRLFIISSAPIITGILSYLIFDWRPRYLFVFASFAVILAIFLYNVEEKRKCRHASNC